ncbi:unnamed protein product [Mycena citricolor]|uniref:Uncharacterized protein n=2 Tax=Mycena citricolor TaxID=2018698 RepID=A0AAD2JV40_9AGAR|nr:unnamed protein product [Mycena citricolor]
MRLPVFALSLYTAFLGQTQGDVERQGAVDISGGSVSGTTPTRNNGTIIQPGVNSMIWLDMPFPFEYKPSNWCHTGYTHISVWLMDHIPGAEDLDGSGKPLYAQHHFGDWTMSNYAHLPDAPDKAPNVLYLRRDGPGVPEGGYMYFSVVEHATGCPPRNSPTQYGITSNQVYVH